MNGYVGGISRFAALKIGTVSARRKSLTVVDQLGHDIFHPLVVTQHALALFVA